MNRTELQSLFALGTHIWSSSSASEWPISLLNGANLIKSKDKRGSVINYARRYREV